MTRALRAVRRRPIAALLLAVFLGAGTTLPGPDALLHHGSPRAGERLGSHIEPAGGCASHTDSCTLGRTATGAGAVLAHASVARPLPAGGVAVEPVPHVPLRAADRGLIPQPRAPPVPVA